MKAMSSNSKLGDKIIRNKLLRSTGPSKLDAFDPLSTCSDSPVFRPSGSGPAAVPAARAPHPLRDVRLSALLLLRVLLLPVVPVLPAAAGRAARRARARLPRRGQPRLHHREV